MTPLMRRTVMEMLRDAFEENTVVSREEAESITGLSERSIARAYYLETGEFIVKMDPFDMPAIATGTAHVSYVRVKDMSASQARAAHKYFKAHREGVVAWDDALMEQLLDVIVA